MKIHGKISAFGKGIIFAGILYLGAFTSGEAAPQPAKGNPAFFPKMEGWKGPEEIQVFSPETLYDYINGAADLYVKYDFQELQVGEYQGPEKASIAVELYRHRTPTQAFGIYSQERGPAAEYLPIGVQGYREEGILVFLSGNYYVKINGVNLKGKDAEILTPLASKVAKNLGTQGTLPSALAAFPERGRQKNSEKFIAKNFLGYAFLHSGFTADYERAGKKFKLFIIEGESSASCRDMLRQYLEKVRAPKRDLAEGTYRIPDPYHGKIDLIWKGRHIWGVLGLDDDPLRVEYLGLLEKGIRK